MPTPVPRVPPVGPRLLWAIAAAAVTAAGVVAQSCALAQDRPSPLRALEKQGLTVVGTFPSPGGLTAWAGYMGQQPIALYATPDGKHVIAGALLDADGKDVNRAVLEKTVSKPMTDGVWGQLQGSRSVADGSDKAPRTVYVFTDPNCPYCNKFWSDARPWVNAGKVQLRHIIVGILTPTSPNKAAALLADKNPAATLAAYERAQSAATAKGLASGRPRPLGDEGIRPLSLIPPAVQAQLDGNEKLMTDLGLRATPAVVWRDSKGAVQMRTGVPDQALAEIMGPR
ncbi:thiol:disulfide interchange protein DsbG [Cupriavidus basilensis]|uniref:Thiol:disulfide interchange protein n=1 Tax=Cupriavidus basilensis TaxID=68895 RepID=A0ABT6AMB0_9BURK|nr:thiol:disulfide interchange protein DsbG [Cupriavidus basilensis]MDF3833442.1 thiol:disulfide interchange protein DsbG [Cupriavidus basilensis]